MTVDARARTARVDTASVGMVLDGTYRLTRLIGEGGMGRVYEATHERLPGNRYAVKVLNPEIARKPEFVARFRREAEIASCIGHDNIVRIHDFREGGDGAPAFIAMELLTGESLADRMARERVTPDEACSIVERVASALDAAHSAGVVHRDLKPENIFLAKHADGTTVPKVLDFGISKVRGADRLTATNTIIGTAWYMAPEQATADPNIGCAADVFSLGAIAYELLTGAVPFDGENIPVILYRIVHEPVAPASTLAPALSSGVDEVLTESMAKQPDARYPSAGAFAQALRAALHGAPERHAVALADTVAAVGLPAPLPARRGRARLYLALGMALAIGGTLLATAALRPRPTLPTQLMAADLPDRADRPHRHVSLAPHEPERITPAPEPATPPPRRHPRTVKRQRVAKRAATFEARIADVEAMRKRRRLLPADLPRYERRLREARAAIAQHAFDDAGALLDQLERAVAAPIDRQLVTRKLERLTKLAERRGGASADPRLEALFRKVHVAYFAGDYDAANAHLTRLSNLL